MPGRRVDAVYNFEELTRAATAAVHREGLGVPMGTIAADAGVGVGTLYRHFATREELLRHLTHRSFEQILANAQAAESSGSTPIECLRLFVEAAIAQRDRLVLPLHGGPPVTSPETASLRDQVRETISRIVAHGVADGTLRPDVTARDVVMLGALLAQPGAVAPGWDATCRRMLATFLRGLAA